MNQRNVVVAVLLIIIVLAVGSILFRVLTRPKAIERRDVSIQEIQQKMRGRRAVDHPGFGTEEGFKPKPPMFKEAPTQKR